MSIGGGLFITFEGIDGAGKSSHLAAAEALCVAAGRVVVRSREPGGTPLAERLREALLHQPMDGVTETLLVFAARRDHVVRVIAPALARGDVVLCDRFSDASFAYQGAGRGQSLALLERLEAAVQEGLQPDLTLWFDLEPRLAAERRAAARTADRFEAEDVAFFEKVRAGYRARMTGAPERFVRIDSARPREQVVADVAAALHVRLAAPPAGARSG